MKEADRVQVVHRVVDDCFVADLSGTLDEISYLKVRDCLIKLLVERPRALVVNLNGLDVASESLLTVFSLVWIRTSEWPDVPIRLVVSEAALREAIAASAVNRVLPVYTMIDRAIASLSAGSPPRRGHAVYQPLVANSGAARAFVHQACHEWGVASCAPDAVYVITELVENALRHARTEFEVSVELHRDRLSLAVRDGSPDQAVLRQAGLGLRLVSQLAKAWGCSPDLRGGKVTWATLATREPWFTRYPEWQSPGL